MDCASFLQRHRLSIYYLIAPLSVTVALYLHARSVTPAVQMASETTVAASALLIAAVARDNHGFSHSNFTLFLAYGYFWTGVIDLIHALLLPAAGSLHLDPQAFAQQFQRGGNLLEAVVLFTAPLAFSRHLWRMATFSGLALFTAALTISAFAGIPRPALVPGSMTVHGYVSYLIAALLIAALFNLHLHRHRFLSRTHLLLSAAIATLLFTQLLYIVFPAAGLRNGGQLLKLLGYLFIYQALAGDNPVKPFSRLSRHARNYDAIPDPIVVADRDGIIHHANRAARTLAASAFGLLEGRHCHELFHAEDIAAADCPACNHNTDTTQAKSARYEVMRDGSWYDLTVSPIRTGNRSLGTVQVLHDTTEQKRNEELRNRQETLLAEALRNAHMGYWELRLRSNTVTLSAELLSLLALPPRLARIGYARFLDAVHPVDRADVTASVDAMRAGMPQAELTYRIRLADGSERYLATYARLRYGPDGTPGKLFGTMHDVTASMRADEERRQIAAQLEAVFVTSRSHIAYLDASFNFLRVNPNYAKGTGLSARQLVGRNYFELFPNSENEEIFRLVVASGAPYTAEGRPQVDRHAPERGLTYWDWTLHPLTDRDGNVKELVLSLNDVTDRQRATKLIYESERRYRTLMENASDGILLIDLKRRVSDANGCILDMLSCTKESLQNTLIYDLFVPTDIDHLRATMTTVLEGRQVLEEFTMLRQHGATFPVEISAALADYGDDKAILISVRDIAKRKKGEEALRQSEARSRAIISQAGIGIKICTAEGRLIETNKALHDLLGYTHEELYALGWDVVLPADETHDNQFVPLALWEGLIDFYQTQRRYLHKNGSLIWADCIISVVHDDHGHPLFSIEMITDITEKRVVEAQRQAHERELNIAKRAAEQASAAKTRFLAAASHDLRQPIQAIHLLAHLLGTSRLEPGTAELVARMQNAIDGLSGMLNTLLDISKLEAGLVVPDVTDFSVAQLMRQLGDEFASLAHEKKLAFTTVTSSATISSDQTLLARILRNLLVNAIRYTSQGRIVFGCRRRADALRIEVVDTGVGIAEEDMQKIFQEFHQVGNRARDRREGLGLGLAIVDRLARLLGHPVEVSSHVGRGTSFAVTVPLAKIDAPATAEGTQLALTMDHPRSTLIIIDDEIDIREGLCMVVAQWGYRVHTGESGADALEALATAGGAVPDLIIADYRLDNETGIDVIQDIRKHFHRKIPGILLTGDTAPDRLMEADASGFVLLNKPVRPDELRRHIAQTLAKKGRRHRPD